MNTHKFVAPTLKDALARIKEELGEDALIIKSERVKAGGRLGTRQTELIEVTAASAAEAKASLQDGPEFAETLNNVVSAAPTVRNTTGLESNLTELTAEVQRLRSGFSDLEKYIKINNIKQLPSELDKLWKAMQSAGLDRQWAADIAHDALIQMGPEELISAPQIENFLVNKLARDVQPAPLMPLRRASQYRIAVIGAPGAGKTTLIQKLVSDPAAYSARKIGLISLDTHRMGAVEQLKAFARIAGTPMEVVFKPQQISAALERLAACELVLIDTFGCPVWDRERMQLLADFMTALNPDEIQLVLNSSVRDEELILAAHRFRDAGITHLSFTRLDESLRHGCLLNVIRAAERPAAWLSKGQGFVGQLERFTPDHLRRWIAMDEARSGEFADQSARAAITVS